MFAVSPTQPQLSGRPPLIAAGDPGEVGVVTESSTPSRR